MDFKSLLKDIKNKQFKPIYALHGEESYYIDVLSDALIEHALSEEERAFNLSVFYGRDSEVIQIINEAKGFPFIGERKLVVVREAQDLKDLYDLEKYCANINPSSILVICHKYKNLDGKRKFTKEVGSLGVNFKSEKIRDYQLPDWIANYVKSEGFDITSKAAVLLADFLGNDLGRIVNELDKLAIVLEKGTRISDIHIEENIGISKDYNNFELTNAIAARDTLKVFQIANYFEKNPKDHSIIVIIPSLFKLYTNMMRVHFAVNKNPDYFASSLGMHPFAAKELIKNAAHYNPKVLARNVAVLHEYDLKAKGVGNTGAFSDGDLLREMLFQLMY
jgi:DNA polymerase III subunit delta